MSRLLTMNERTLLMMLLDVNGSLDPMVIEAIRSQVESGAVDEIDSPNFLAFCHDQGEAFSNVHRLPVELVANDGGVPVLIYATIVENPGVERLDTFVVDRMDGALISEYPIDISQMMIVQGGKMMGGADLRHIYVVE